MNITQEVYVEVEGTEYTFEAEGTVSFGYHGRSMGPPEDCYPGEGPGVEWNEELRCVETGKVWHVADFELLKSWDLGKPWTIGELDADAFDKAADSFPDPPSYQGRDHDDYR